MRCYYLQFARFLAAVYVLFFHKFSTGVSIIDFVIGKGDMAVSFFFILSGYVITASLMRKPSGFKEYMFRRCQKIMPQWILSMIISIAVAGSLQVSAIRFLLSLLLLQAVYPDYSLDINFVGWSLSVELIMYMVLFLVIKYSNIQSRSFAICVFMVWFITQVAYMIVYNYNIKQYFSGLNWHHFIFYHPIWHLSSFLMGILCAVYSIRMNLPVLLKIPYPALMISIMYACIVILCCYAGYKAGWDQFYHNGFFAPLTGLYLILISCVEKSELKGKRKWRNHLFDVLGGISFGIYLFHIPVYDFLSHFFVVGNNGWTFWLYFTAVLLFSYLSYKLLDEVLQRLTMPVLERLRTAN